uniref:Ribonuclease H2 subunit B wHTH domain-containing protein n=1 Tax=Spumella elongata TaxID=89044 RepID=A0A7S3HJE8_9STRA
MYELQITQPRKYSSWFINQRVSSGQDIYMANVFDPRFLCLPFLEKSAGKYSPLDQIVFMDAKYARFPFTRASSWKLGEMCDVNDKLGDDMILYRYNEVKMLEWLGRKVENTAKALMKQRLARASSQNTTFASGFNISKQSTAVVASSAAAADAVTPSREDIVLAVEIISDYLTPSAAQKLLQAHSVNATDLSTKNASASLKRKTDWEQELELEKETLAFSTVASKVTATTSAASSSSNQSTGVSGTSNASSAKPVSTAVKASAKANTAAAKGTKSLFSFFGAKK